MFVFIGIKRVKKMLGIFELDCSCGIGKGELFKVEDTLNIFFLPIASWNISYAIKCLKCKEIVEVNGNKLKRVLQNRRVGYYDIEK